MPGRRTTLHLDVSPSSRGGVGLRSERGPILRALMLSTGLIASTDDPRDRGAVDRADIGGFAQFPWLFSITCWLRRFGIGVREARGHRRAKADHPARDWAVPRRKRAVRGGRGACRPSSPSAPCRASVPVRSPRWRSRSPATSTAWPNGPGAGLHRQRLGDLVGGRSRARRLFARPHLWRWIFFVNVPLCLLAARADLAQLPREGGTHAPHIDYPGAALLTSHDPGSSSGCWRAAQAGPGAPRRASRSSPWARPAGRLHSRGAAGGRAGSAPVGGLRRRLLATTTALAPRRRCDPHRADGVRPRLSCRARSACRPSSRALPNQLLPGLVAVRGRGRLRRRCRRRGRALHHHVRPGPVEPAGAARAFSRASSSSATFSDRARSCTDCCSRATSCAFAASRRSSSARCFPTSSSRSASARASILLPRPLRRRQPPRRVRRARLRRLHPPAQLPLDPRSAPPPPSAPRPLAPPPAAPPRPARPRPRARPPPAPPPSPRAASRLLRLPLRRLRPLQQRLLPARTLRPLAGQLRLQLAGPGPHRFQLRPELGARLVPLGLRLSQLRRKLVHPAAQLRLQRQRLPCRRGQLLRQLGLPAPRGLGELLEPRLGLLQLLALRLRVSRRRLALPGPLVGRLGQPRRASSSWAVSPARSPRSSSSWRAAESWSSRSFSSRSARPSSVCASCPDRRVTSPTRVPSSCLVSESSST